jgi:chromosome segregation ATPase
MTDSSDLVERLRCFRATAGLNGPLLEEAAAALQRLEAEKADLQNEVANLHRDSATARESDLAAAETTVTPLTEVGELVSAINRELNGWPMPSVTLTNIRLTLQRLEAEKAEIVASSDAVCDSYATENQQFHDKITALQSERDRLRGVLTEISNSAFGDDATNELSMEGCISLARRALAGKD